MQFPHLFEFMDQDWVRGGLRTTLREILECGNGPPFRNYYPWVAGEILRAARERNLTKLVELGCGTAPITRTLARLSVPASSTLIPCDLNPDEPTLRQLATQFPSSVSPIYDAVDFSHPIRFPAGVNPSDTLLYLSATLHHIPAAQRAAVVKSLQSQADTVIIFEPLRKTFSSVLFVFLSIVPALLIPLWYLNRPGRLRRFVWCWLIPIAPVMFWWDGFVSCIRQWSVREWSEAIGVAEERSVVKTLFCQAIVLSNAQERLPREALCPAR